MKDIELQAERKAFEAWYEAYCMPSEADWFRRDVDDESEYHHAITADAWAAWLARAAVEADRAQRVPDGWVQVTQHLLNSQEPWLYKPCWLAFPSGAVLRGVYEWRQGRNPDRFISDEVGDVWAFDVSHVMPISTPPHPSKAALAPTPAQPAQQERKPMTYREIADATSEWAHVRSDYTIGIIRAAERHHGIRE